jgi:hypothetical protein
VAERLIEEGLRTEEFPGIAFRSGPTGRRVGLVGGPDVWEIAREPSSTSASNWTRRRLSGCDTFLGLRPRDPLREAAAGRDVDADDRATGAKPSWVALRAQPAFNRRRGERVIGQMVNALAHFLSSPDAAQQPLNRAHCLREAPDGA